jgi:hypothetical protein
MSSSSHLPTPVSPPLPPIPTYLGAAVERVCCVQLCANSCCVRVLLVSAVRVWSSLKAIAGETWSRLSSVAYVSLEADFMAPPPLRCTSMLHLPVLLPLPSFRHLVVHSLVLPLSCCSRDLGTKIQEKGIADTLTTKFAALSATVRWVGSC